MDLSIEQKNKFIKFINEKWPEPQICPVCKAQQWVIPDFIYEVHEVRPRNVRMTKMTPLIEIICGSCGYTIFLNAFVSGIYEEDMKASNEARCTPAESSISKK